MIFAPPKLFKITYKDGAAVPAKFHFDDCSLIWADWIDIMQGFMGIICQFFSGRQIQECDDRITNGEG